MIVVLETSAVIEASGATSYEPFFSFTKTSYFWKVPINASGSFQSSLNPPSLVGIATREVTAISEGAGVNEGDADDRSPTPTSLIAATVTV